VWIDGEWLLRRGRWAWSVGRWVVVPPHVRYSPWTLARGADGARYFAPGAFWDADGKPVDPPPPLVAAKPATAPVVDSEGITETVGRTLRALPADAPSSAPVAVPSGGSAPVEPVR